MEPAEFTAIRTALGFSQTGIARALNTSQGTISRWESGKSSIPPHIELTLPTLRRNQMESTATRITMDLSQYGMGTEKTATCLAWPAHPDDEGIYMMLPATYIVVVRAPAALGRDNDIRKGPTYTERPGAWCTRLLGFVESELFELFPNEFGWEVSLMPHRH